MNATGGALKPEKCFWYLPDYKCVDGEWSYAEAAADVLMITNHDGTKSPIKQEKVTESKKTRNLRLAIRRQQRSSRLHIGEGYSMG